MNGLKLSEFMESLTKVESLKDISDAINGFTNSLVDIKNEITEIKVLIENKNRGVKQTYEMSALEKKEIELFTNKYFEITRDRQDFVTIETLRAYYKIEFLTLKDFVEFSKRLYYFNKLEITNKNVKQEDGKYKTFRCILGVVDLFEKNKPVV
jgi:hypothetical protein